MYNKCKRNDYKYSLLLAQTSLIEKEISSSTVYLTVISSHFQRDFPAEAGVIVSVI